MTETKANGYSSESTQRELSNEYQHDRVKMIFRNLCVLVLGTKVASALKGIILVCSPELRTNMFFIVENEKEIPVSEGCCESTAPEARTSRLFLLFSFV